jgi:hypothetical protein
MSPHIRYEKRGLLMQIVEPSSIQLIGYASQNDLIVLRRRPGQGPYTVFFGTGKTPLEDVMSQREERDIPASDTFGLLGKCERTAYLLSTGAELISSTFAVGVTNSFTFVAGQKTAKVLPLPADHFEFCMDDQSLLCVERKSREVKYSGSISQGVNIDARIILTGLQQKPIEEWIKSAEIFAAPVSASKTPRLRVTSVTKTPRGYELATDLGVLKIQSLKSITGRKSWMTVYWNDTPIREYAPNRVRQIHNADGFLL